MGEGAFILGLEGTALSPDEAAFFAEARPWGFILFQRNVESPGQLRRLTDALRECVGRAAPVLIDQEGGRVQRLGPPHWRQWLPPLEQAARAGVRAPESFRLRYRIIAHELRAVGIDANCAPCADVATPGTHPVLRNRCMGTAPGEVTANARAAADGLMAGGVLPVLKHIPGHGRATADSHLELPRVTAPRDRLEAVDFAPFRALSDLPAGMSAHVVFEALDGNAPATTSARVIRLIRAGIGFGGLLMSDDISMNALSGDIAARSRAAIAAGVDLVLHCNGDLGEMQAVTEAAGMMAPEAQARADRAIAARAEPDEVDIRALEGELEALLKERARADG